MSRRVETNAPEEQVPRGVEPPANFQDEMSKLVEATDKNTKQLQDLRILIHTIREKIELGGATSLDLPTRMYCQNMIQRMEGLIDNNAHVMQDFHMVIDGLGKTQESETAVARMNRVQAQADNMGQYPVSEELFDCVEPMEQMSIRDDGQKSSNSSGKPPAEPNSSSSPEIEILGQVMKRGWERVSVKQDPADEIIVLDQTSTKKRKSVEPGIVLLSSTQEKNSSTIEKEQQCIFCKSGNHSAHHCSEYKSPNERISAALKMNLCPKCVEPLSNERLNCHSECPKTVGKCMFCHSKMHNSIFCGGPETNIKSRKYCEFCKDRSHDSENCSDYFIGTTAKQRKKRLEYEKKCMKCFQCIKKEHECPNEGHICRLCYPQSKDPVEAAHNPLICEYFYDDKKPRTN